MTLEIAIQQYFEWMRVHAYSDYTIDHRRGYLVFFLRWCSEHGISEPTELTRVVLERYQRSTAHALKKDGEPLSVHGQIMRLSALRALCSWMAKTKIVLYNPASELELPQRAQRLPRRVLNLEEMEQLINHPDVHTPLGLRDRAILELFYSTGIRRSEMVRVAIHDLDFESGMLLVREGKGKRDRYVPVGERAIIWTRKYLDEVRSELAVTPDDGTMFVTKYGKPFARAGMSTLVKRLVAKAGLGDKGSCHALRHSMATAMLEGGADIRHIQLMLGHASVKTTAIYTRVALRTLKAVHEATHPSSKLRPDSEVEPDGDHDLHPDLGGDPGQS